MWLQRLSHLMPGVHKFPFWKFERQGVATFPSDPENPIRVHLTLINGCLGTYLAMVRQDMQDMLHCCQLCTEIRGGYVDDVGA